MEVRPPIWGYLRIYEISSRGQPTRVSPPASVLGEVLTTPHRKTGLVTKRQQLPQTWTDSLIQTKQ